MVAVTFSHRHLVSLAFGVAAACGGRHANVAPPPSVPAQTVEQFLTATNASDLEHMGALWGDEHGPNSGGADNVRTQRLTIMQRLLHGESHEIVATDLTNPARPKLSVLITQGTRRFTVPFTMAAWH